MARAGEQPKQIGSASRGRSPALRDVLPVPSGSYSIDIEAGEQCARGLLAKINATNSRCLLGMMILEMTECGYHENAKGIIVGFMAAVAGEIPMHPFETLLREQRRVHA